MESELPEPPSKDSEKVSNNKTHVVVYETYQGDDPRVPFQPSGLMQDLDNRFDRNDDGLIASYISLRKYNRDQSTLSTIEELKSADKEIMNYIVQVIRSITLHSEVFIRSCLILEVMDHCRLLMIQEMLSTC